MKSLLIKRIAHSVPAMNIFLPLKPSPIEGVDPPTAKDGG